MKRQFIIFSSLVMVVLLLSTTAILASPSGPRDNYTGSPPNYLNCTNCHNSFALNSGAGSLSITGLPAAYQQGVVYPLTLTLSDPQANRWGFQVTAVDPTGATAGALTVSDSINTQWNDNATVTVDIIMHTLVGTYEGTTGSGSWDFDWRAPMNSNGAIFHASGNAANTNGSTSGDYIYNSTLFVPAATAPSMDLVLTYNGGSPIPAGGGNLEFGVYLENTGAVALNFDAWIDIVYNQGAPSTVVLRSFTGYQPGWAVNRPDMFFPIPGGYAAGNYTFTGKAGTSGTAIWVWSGFPFAKSGAIDGLAFNPWTPDGLEDPFADITTTGEAQVEHYHLFGNYPNPFNPSTTIGFDLPEAGQVALNVYDVSGRLQSTLVDGYREAGRHEAVFDATGLPSGLYLYRLQMGSETVEGKMILMK